MKIEKLLTAALMMVCTAGTVAELEVLLLLLWETTLTLLPETTVWVRLQEE